MIPNPAHIALHTNAEGKVVYGLPKAPPPLPAAEWLQQLTKAACWIQGRPLSQKQRQLALAENVSVRQAVRKIFGELAEDCYFSKDIDPKHWKLNPQDEAIRRDFISQRNRD